MGTGTTVKIGQLLALMFVFSSEAFAPLPSSRYAGVVQRAPSKHSWRSIPVKTALRDEFSSESLDSSAYAPTTASTGEDSNAAVADLGTEIFLGSLEDNLASTKELIGDVAETPKVQAVPFDSDLLANDTTSFLQDGVKGMPDLPPVIEEDTKETVSAILALSSEAVERAHETFDQQVSFVGDLNVTDSVTPIMEVTQVPEIVPAAEVLGETIETPSVMKILKFAVPAIGVWLCGPLLSLIDTSSVGILSGTVQQAALNPAVAVTDYAALLIAFLYTATTNMIAEARESDRGVDGKMPRTSRTFVGAMQFSTFVGAGLGAILFVFAKPLLRAIIGNDGISPAVFAAAMKYVKIRALGMPAAAVIGSAQAACLGLQDIRSPLYVLLAAAVVNFMGDMLFVGSTHPWIGGAAGAAWATVFSQYAAVSLFVYWLTHKAKNQGKAHVVDVSKAILELTGKPKSAGKTRRKKFVESIQNLRVSTKQPKKTASVGGETATMASISEKFEQPSSETTPIKAEQKKEKSFSVRGFLHEGFKARDLLKLPRRDIVKDFSPYILPVTSTQVGRVSGYVAMSHVVSSALGTASMAAQQVIVSLFYCLCPIADSLSLTAQSFVPSVAGKKRSKERTAALRKIALNFVKAGAVFGAVMVGAVACIPFLSKFFTADPYVATLVTSVAPLLVGFFAVHGVLCACEGLLLGQKDLGFLGKSYAAYFVIVPYFMLRVKRAALAGTRVVNLSSVWTVFLGYQMSRATAWVLRVLMLQRRTSRETPDLAP